MIILYTDIESINCNDFSNLLRYIPEEGKDRILSYSFDTGRYRAIAGELLARYALCERKGIDAKLFARQFRIERTQAGKPFFRGEDFHYSVSHSGRYAVCAAGDEVGVDIERIKKLNQRVAEKIFSDKEICEMNGSVDPDRKFYEIWTRKESYIKADGRGFGYPNIKNISYEGYTVSNFNIHSDYAAAVCFKGEIPFLVKEADLLKIFL